MQQTSSRRSGAAAVLRQQGRPAEGELSSSRRAWLSGAKGGGQLCARAKRAHASRASMGCVAGRSAGERLARQGAGMQMPLARELGSCAPAARLVLQLVATAGTAAARGSFTEGRKREARGGRVCDDEPLSRRHGCLLVAILVIEAVAGSRVARLALQSNARLHAARARSARAACNWVYRIELCPSVRVWGWTCLQRVMCAPKVH